MLFFRTNESFLIKENPPFPRPFYIAHVISDESRLNKELVNRMKQVTTITFQLLPRVVAFNLRKIPLRSPFVNFFFLYDNASFKQARI